MKSKKILGLSYIVYLLLLTWIIVFKFRLDFSSLDYIRSVNFIPFRGNWLVNGISETLVNLLLFIPVGVYVKLIFNDSKVLVQLVYIATISVLFEVLQYILCVGVSDITDVVMNLLGGIIGIIFISFVLNILLVHFDEVDVYKWLGYLSCVGVLLVFISLFLL